MAVELHKTPDEIRAMSSRDFLYLIATITKGAKKPLAWGKGGAAVVRGWADQLRKQRGKGERGRSTRVTGTEPRRPAAE